MPASISTGPSEEKATGSDSVLFFSDEAQEDLQRALLFRGRMFPVLKKLRPVATPCIDVVFSPEELDALLGDIDRLISKRFPRIKHVGEGLRKELGELAALIRTARQKGWYVSAHIE